MDPLIIILICISVLLLLVLGLSFYCFYATFYVNRRARVKSREEYPIPEGKIYEPHRELMVSWMKEAKNIEGEDIYIESFDGTRLHARYYRCNNHNGITEIMFHGYRGSAERDMCGGIQRCFRLGHNALIVDQRTSGESEGSVITFGVRESRDCAKWAWYAAERFGKDARLILCGISMGASTVMMATALELPPNVVGVLADCGFSSAKEIIKKVINQLGLPATPLYPFVKLGARIFGGFDLEENPPIQALAKCKIPVMFIHGTDDDFVPAEMSQKNYDACLGKKDIFKVEGAGHGLGYIIDPDGYVEALRRFFH
jgi:fermentation-respiration switch protein FrsA (DUF1100 family)